MINSDNPVEYPEGYPRSPYSLAGADATNLSLVQSLPRTGYTLQREFIALKISAGGLLMPPCFVERYAGIIKFQYTC